MNSALLESAKALPLSERIELVEAIWESIASEGYEAPLTKSQLTEIDARVEDLRANPQTGIPWEQVKTAAKTSSLDRCRW